MKKILALLALMMAAGCSSAQEPQPNRVDNPAAERMTEPVPEAPLPQTRELEIQCLAALNTQGACDIINCQGMCECMAAEVAKMTHAEILGAQPQDVQILQSMCLDRAGPAQKKALTL